MVIDCHAHMSAPQQLWAHRALLPAHAILPPLADRPGIAGVHLCLADRGASGIETEEKRGRERALIPNWVLLVEGARPRSSRLPAARRCRRRHSLRVAP